MRHIYRWLSLCVALPVLCHAPVAAAGDAIPIPGLRITGGAVWHVDPERDVIGALDVLPNIQLYSPDSEMYASILMGYGFEGGGDTHLFQFGFEVGVAPSIHATAALGLRGVLGSTDGEFGGGVRLTAGFDLFFGVLHVETAYQVLDSHDRAEQDLRFMAGLDLVRFLLVPFMAFADDL